jgi:hypothetical protein
LGRGDRDGAFSSRRGTGLRPPKDYGRSGGTARYGPQAGEGVPVELAGPPGGGSQPDSAAISFPTIQLRDIAPSNYRPNREIVKAVVCYAHEAHKSCVRPRAAGSSHAPAGSKNLLCRRQPCSGGGPSPAQDSEIAWGAPRATQFAPRPTVSLPQSPSRTAFRSGTRTATLRPSRSIRASEPET